SLRSSWHSQVALRARLLPCSISLCAKPLTERAQLHAMFFIVRAHQLKQTRHSDAPDALKRAASLQLIERQLFDGCHVLTPRLCELVERRRESLALIIALTRKFAAINVRQH